MTTTQFHAYAGSKVVQFSIFSFLACLIISGLLRLISLVKMSEEAGIQFFGSDNVAIWKVRLIVITTSSIMSIVLIQDSGNFETVFYPDTTIKEVIFSKNFYFLSFNSWILLSNLNCKIFGGNNSSIVSQRFCSTWIWMMSCMHLKKWGLVYWDWYFGERMETSSMCEKDMKRKDQQNIVQKLCLHTVNGKTNKH